MTILGGGAGGVGTMSRLFAKLTTICNDLQGLDSNSFLLCWWFFQLRISELCLFLFPWFFLNERLLVCNKNLTKHNRWKYRDLLPTYVLWQNLSMPKLNMKEYKCSCLFKSLYHGINWRSWRCNIWSISFEIWTKTQSNVVTGLRKSVNKRVSM